MQRYGVLQRQGRWRREAVWGTVKEKRLACQVRYGVVEGGGDWSQGNSSDILCSPTGPLTSQTSHIPHPQARMLPVGPRWRGGGKRLYPCRAGPGDLQSRAVAAGPRWVTEFPPPAFHNPRQQGMKSSPRKKREPPLPCQGPQEGGWAKIRNRKG